jgi:hypothetical protein
MEQQILVCCSQHLSRALLLRSMLWYDKLQTAPQQHADIMALVAT